MAHTPGPWHLEHGEIVGAHGERIAWGWDDGSILARPANLQVMLMAPELLAACKALRDGAYGNPSCPAENNAIDALADEAIAKAEAR